MLYVHQAHCISAQHTFGSVDIDQLQPVVNNKLQVIEPSYEGIPTGVLRRMGRAIRMGVGAALPIIKSSQQPVQGIIIGTADGGLEDCIKFLNQIIDYEEGMLTPTNFVQSTTNAIAAQIGLLSANTSYNTTHVHRGLAFENALLDAIMLLQEDAHAQYLVGGVDEISAYNYNIDQLNGWFKKEPVTAATLYSTDSTGSIAGEGAALFLVNNEPQGASAAVTAVHLFQTTDHSLVIQQLHAFLQKNLLPKQEVDLFLSGENGDNRLTAYYTNCEQQLTPGTAVARFKHMMGEYATCTAAALWLANRVLKTQTIPAHMLKYDRKPGSIKTILLYNCFKGMQHSFMLVQQP